MSATNDALFQEMRLKLSSAERPWWDIFYPKVLTNLHTPLGITASWCDPPQLLELFRFFLAPLDRQAVRVRVEALSLSEQPAGPPLAEQPPQGAVCALEGTRIAIHMNDTPFILDTLRNYLKQRRLAITLQTHTTLSIHRDGEGALQALLEEDNPAARREMLIVILAEPLPDLALVTQVQEELTAVMLAVKQSVEDFPAMRDQLLQEIPRLEQARQEATARFVHWVVEDNFVFMGLHPLQYRDGALHPLAAEPPLGVFRGGDSQALLDLIMPGVRQEMDAALLDAASQNGQGSLAIDYCQHGRAIIYAAEGVDFFITHHLDADGARRLLLVLGRFSRAALATRASSVPILAEKLQEVLRLAGHPPGAHLHHEYRGQFDRLPLRELFYAEPAAIAAQIQEMTAMQGDTDVKVLARRGRRGDYAALSVALSHNRYRAHLEEEVAALWSRHAPHPVTATLASETGALHLIVCYLPLDPDQPLVFDWPLIAAEARALVLTWKDRLREALLLAYPPHQALALLNSYLAALAPLYREATPPLEAAGDLLVLEQLRHNGRRFASRIVQAADRERLWIKLYTLEGIPLSRIVQTFDHLGISCLHEFSAEAALPDGRVVRIQRFEVDRAVAPLDLLAMRGDLLAAALAAIQQDRLLDDRLNHLVLLEGLAPAEVTLLRALRQYLARIIPEAAPTTVNRVLITHHPLARLILETFLTRFDPTVKRRKALLEEKQRAFETALSSVVSLQDDQILRRLHNCVLSAVRTNYFVERPNAALSIKIASDQIDDLPPPRPWREIFVLGPHLEGIHLRGGKVARGGIRHSDRLEDYRTEILGLMKTQMVKNAIIVPVGAKGGFVLPRLAEIDPAQRKEWVAQQYQHFIRALLDLADNRVGAETVHPRQVVCHDAPDPYLVVAADKGTATFSDLANRIAQEEYQFWLGDAFASGGSRGYDHKKVGITARGAWRCIALHFHEMGRDIHHHPFTVVGIGDMAGDVFGNGLLQSRQIKLVGAFNHQHIFLDPDPDGERSFAERERLFRLPRSSWLDYDPQWISPGGGVFERSAKAIPLNPELRRLLGVKGDNLSGEQVIQRLLTAKVDLLYNGGIGAYIKASTESHVEVSDKANDAVRVNGREVRALVIGEGGNLGITQRGRLELARHGCRLNTDAVDNSGGVDLSDHEVNLKILCDDLLRNGLLANQEERNALLARLTEEVAERVLEDNRMQHQAISRDAALSARQGASYLEALTFLEEKAGLDPRTEQIPDRDLLAQWLAEGGMPRPLLAIMLGYTKLFIDHALLASEVVDLDFCEHYLSDYFPVSVSREYHAQLAGHYLRREIIANTIANRVINQTGVGPFLTAFQQARHDKGEANPQATLVKAYIIAEHLLDAPTFRKQMGELGTRAAARVKDQALGEMEAVLLHLASWMLQHLTRDQITTDLITLYHKPLWNFRQQLWDLLPLLVSPQKLEQLAKQRAALATAGLTDPLAASTVLLPYLRESMTIIHLQETLRARFEDVGHLYIRVDDFFGLEWVTEGLEGVQLRDVWGKRMLENVKQELWEIRMRLVKGIITFKRHNESVAVAFANYVQEVKEENDDYQEMLATLKQQNQQNLLPMSVLVRKLRDLLRQEAREEY